jgi:hyperosmotically inducible periplasmic protein
LEHENGQKAANAMKKAFSVLGASLLLAGTVLAAPPQQDQQPAPDNTKTNRGDADKNATTADQQKMRTRHCRLIPQHKIITRNGMVTLKGPVRSEDEKSAIQAKAEQVAGASSVTNKLTVAPASAAKQQ